MMLTSAASTKMNAMMAIADATARGIRRASMKSTAGFRRSCRSSERKMMNAKS